ncbi:MAG: hypothetical protein ACR2P4_01155 [Gammaproteobacteria bacterium]
MTTLPPIPAFIKKQGKNIRKLKTDAPAFEINEASWKKYFAKDAEVMRLVKKFRNGVSRDKVVACAPKSKKPTYPQLRPLFLAAVIWGYGSNGYGAWRTRKMLRDANIKKVLPLACRHILDGDMEAARKSFVLSWCGPSFYTKFFYFIGRAHNIRPMPLILDSRVIGKLNRKAPKLAQKIAYCKMDENGGIADFRIKRNGYPLYVNTLNDWAAKMKVKPDQLEMFLFGD